MSAAYYNEIDPYCAQWLRNLIAAGHIADGVVDERSIEDVRPDDLRGFTQCHFFAGIGGWPLALRRARWPDDRSVWSGSAPCQPFSQAGEGLGFADERHLWPAFYWLIAQCSPSEVVGEQVASKDVDDWIDLVQSDLEALGYAFGSVPFPSSGVGAPHIRDRNYWMAHANNSRSQRRRRVRERAIECATGSRGVAGIVADSHIGSGPQGRALNGGRYSGGDAIARPGFGGNGLLGELGHSNSKNLRGESGGGDCSKGEIGDRQSGDSTGASDRLREELAGPTNGFWRDADWLFCRDEKWRPVEPGTFPLADGLPKGMGKLSTEQRRLAELAGLDSASLKRAKAYRVGTLRGYGNAINVEAAAEFIRAADEALTQS
ncbi:DNA cytosine methyltransferase [Paraburkholderia sp. BCC1884]|uniref:DNA cytosine methyltransferase n=1 Tax=Paraburkholderia sp. BCC1884 TaxID=2562668 RepID=UPI001183F212|nr:DNA cytosine methyltransferase [Paraburkholderia sp. BCC1884]